MSSVGISWQSVSNSVEFAIANALWVNSSALIKTVCMGKRKNWKNSYQQFFFIMKGLFPQKDVLKHYNPSIMVCVLWCKVPDNLII